MITMRAGSVILTSLIPPVPTPRLSVLKIFLSITLLFIMGVVASAAASAQGAALLWDQTKYYRYNIHWVSYDPPTVTVVFSVTNPEDGNKPYDIRSGVAPFKSPRNW
jgi:hypothetical protein